MLPAGACDTHCHIFGPQSQFPFAPSRKYTPEEAPKAALFALHARLGIDRAVIVQPAAHGLDNSVTLDAIAASGGRYRGIALIAAGIAAEALRMLHCGGIRGIRLNFVPHLSPPPTLEAFRLFCALVAPLGWHIVVHVGPGDLPFLKQCLSGQDVPLVIDHMARISAGEGLDQPGFRQLLELAEDPRIWIKISGADRASSVGAPYRDVIPFMRALVDAAPDRILWGTDWPHPNIAGPVPDETVLLDLLADALESEKRLHKVLVDNPARLYGF